MVLGLAAVAETTDQEGSSPDHGTAVAATAATPAIRRLVIHLHNLIHDEDP